MAKKPPVVSFGERLKQLREAAGLSVAELAQKAGMQRTHLHAIEAGTKGRQPSFFTVSRLASALGIKLEQFHS